MSGVSSIKSTVTTNSLLVHTPLLLITRPFLAARLIQRKCWALPILWSEPVERFPREQAAHDIEASTRADFLSYLYF